MKTIKDFQRLPDRTRKTILVFAVAALCLLSYLDPRFLDNRGSLTLSDNSISENNNKLIMAGVFSAALNRMPDYSARNLDYIIKAGLNIGASEDSRIKVLTLEDTPEAELAIEPWMTDNTTWFRTDDIAPGDEPAYEPWMTDNKTWFQADDINPVQEPAYEPWMTDNTTWLPSSDYLAQKRGPAVKNGMLNQFLY
jgi:hypothetical protein